MASNFIKVLLLTFSLSAFAGERQERLLYLEEVNYRLNHLNLLAQNQKLLAKIVIELRIIRCQNEESELCDKIKEVEQ